MAITTLDQALAGMRYPHDFAKAVTGTVVAGRHHSLFYLAGYPGAAVAPTPGLKGAALTSYLGQIPFSNPAGGMNSYLARFVAQATQAGTLLLCDRLWHNSGITATLTTAQVTGNTISTSSVASPSVITCSANVPFANGDTVRIAGHSGSTPSINGTHVISGVSAATFTIPVNVSVGGTGGSVGIAFPARDGAGGQDGHGVYLGVEVSGATGAGTPTLTLNYTNTSGVGNRSGVNLVATVATSIAGTFYPIGLAAGDTGVQSVQSYTQSATWSSGTVHVVAYRILARLPLQAQIPTAVDCLTGGFQRLYDNTVPFLLFLPNTTTTSNISGCVVYAQG